MGANTNVITTETWSNAESRRLYETRWPAEPELRWQYEEECWQCGGCSFFAPFNYDWGLCCNPKSRHHLETVFEHFTCPSYVGEGWGPHSFSEDPAFRCRCGGGPFWDEEKGDAKPPE
jgi:hypothetical protein